MQGGVGDYTSWLAAALSRQGAEVSVITSAGVAAGVQTMADISWKANVFAVVPRWSFACWKWVRNIVREQRPDILHIQYQTAGYGMHPAINLLPLRLRLLSRRPKLVVTFHDLKVPFLFPKAGRARGIPGALLAMFSDAVVVTNEEDLARVVWLRDASSPRLRSRYGDRPLHCIPIGSNIPVRVPDAYNRTAWRDKLGVASDEILLAYFGFLNESKGVDVLLGAFGTLVDRRRKVKLLMIGGNYGDSDPTNVAYGQKIRSAVARSPYGDRVLWTGFTNREQVSANLLAADFCVLPFDEGASLRHGSLMATIVHGLPIITTRGQETSHASTRGRVEAQQMPGLENRVVLVPPKDVGALVEAIEQVAGSPALRETLSERVLEIAPEFDWDRIAEATLRVYREIAPVR